MDVGSFHWHEFRRAQNHSVSVKQVVVEKEVDYVRREYIFLTDSVLTNSDSNSNASTKAVQYQSRWKARNSLRIQLDRAALG